MCDEGHVYEDLLAPSPAALASPHNTSVRDGAFNRADSRKSSQPTFLPIAATSTLSPVAKGSPISQVHGLSQRTPKPTKTQDAITPIPTVSGSRGHSKVSNQSNVASLSGRTSRQKTKKSKKGKKSTKNSREGGKKGTKLAEKSWKGKASRRQQKLRAAMKDI